MKKFAEDDRVELMNQTKKRMKGLEHKRAVDLMVAERKRINEEQEEVRRKASLAEKSIEVYKQQVIEQERQRLLREHAVKLVGFLPKATLFLTLGCFARSEGLGFV